MHRVHREDKPEAGSQYTLCNLVLGAVGHVWNPVGESVADHGGEIMAAMATKAVLANYGQLTGGTGGYRAGTCSAILRTYKVILLCPKIEGVESLSRCRESLDRRKGSHCLKLPEIQSGMQNPSFASHTFNRRAKIYTSNW